MTFYAAAVMNGLAAVLALAVLKPMRARQLVAADSGAGEIVAAAAQAARI